MQDLQIQIFLAEDDEDDSELFKLGIYSAGISADITLAENGSQLLSFMSQILPDIIFLDLNMPGMDGKTCLKAIRKNESYNTIPVVIFTTSSSEKDIKDTLKSGANLFVTKPQRIKEQTIAFQKIFSGNWKENLLANKQFVLA